jgi:hypothetical protein
MRRLAAAVLFVMLFASRLFAQAGNASLTGFVQDPAKAFVPGVRVLAINTDTDQQFETTTNKDGSYNISALPVGPYRMQIEKVGFRTVLKEGLFLHTQDALQINYQMAVGSTSETVTVNTDTVNINTTDGTTGMIVDRNFVDKIPMNGRSFQSLILLAPGVTTASPQGTDSGGEYSVNGQRTDANNFTVDGASAMGGAATTTGGPSTSGSLSNFTLLGTTQAMISIDAMQEVRIATSTYSAEYGRTPGGQIAFTSRSGANLYHGTAFDYLRNYIFDANDWFNNYTTPKTPRSDERQNDFGGVFGGPISIPGLFSGRDRAFFFVNYEGIRVSQPLPATISWVPSNGTYNTAASYGKPSYMNLRANAPAVLQPLLNGFPLPNCSLAKSPQCMDFGDGLSPSLYSGVLPQSLNNYSIRMDYRPYSWLRAFARYSDTTSSAATESLYILDKVQTTRTYLLGIDSTMHGSMVNELRLQYSPSVIHLSSTGQSVEGSTSISGQQTPNMWSLQGLPNGGATRIALESFAAGEPASNLYAQHYGTAQFASNAVETLTWSHGTHLFKAGVNYRQITAYTGDSDRGLSYSPNVYYIYTTADQVLSNLTYEVNVNNWLRQDPTFKSLGVFFQDEWRLLPRLTLSLGLRWDLNPPPSVSGAQQYNYTGDINSPYSLALSKQGAPLYKTTYTNFVPRLGIAFVLRDNPGGKLVLRAGGGLFYDTGQAAMTNVIGHGYALGVGNNRTITNVAFPVAPSESNAAIPTTFKPPYTMTFTIAPNYFPSSTVEASASLEQELGSRQSVTFGYVTTEGRNLAQFSEYSFTKFKPEPLFAVIEQYENGPGSNYNALQLQYKRQMDHGLQVLASYTWSHAIDWSSTDYYSGLLSPQRGNSDHDVRHNFNAALIYNIPAPYQNRLEKEILGHWSGALRYAARSAFPVRPVGPTVVDPSSGTEYATRLNWNGMNPYLYLKGIPGGRQFNPSVFSAPASGADGDEPRNFLRGFDENTVEMAIERTFPVTERVHLLFRAEAFNLFNHPNFGTLDLNCGTSTAGGTCTSPLLGQATTTLANSPTTALGPLYQQGGPRSLQFALKLEF